MPNPYHFIPLSDKEGPGSMSFEEFVESPGNARHDVWVKGAMNGRLICHLETRQPTINGNTHGDIVQPFQVPGESGKWEPAIAATTLRGLISSTAEAASLSAMRVIEPSHSAEPNRGDYVDVADFIRKYRADLLPMGSKGRTCITAAELLFGFVSDGNDDVTKSLALASRVRLSNARLAPGQTGPFFPSKATWLTMMLGPNPRSARLYWTGRNGSAQKQSELTPGDHHPQGHKRYLHRSKPVAHTRQGDGDTSWMTGPGEADESMQMRAKPLRPGISFYFHIDFDNLTEYEFDLLCYALNPTDAFEHKLGLAKPLGLGSVKITPVGLFLSDRHQRLQDSSLTPKRWDRAWAADEGESWPERYQREAEAIYESDNAPTPAARGKAFREQIVLIAPEVIHALERLGDPANVQGKVSYFIPSQNVDEFMAPLTGEGGPIPGAQPTED